MLTLALTFIAGVICGVALAAISFRATEQNIREELEAEAQSFEKSSRLQ